MLPALERSERQLRCAVRTPDRLAPRVAPETEVVAADVFDKASLERALAGVDIAYYLVHSMSSDGEFEERDRTAAELFGAAARDRASGGSSTWAGWATAVRCPRTWRAGRRSAGSWRPAASRRSSSARRS